MNRYKRITVIVLIALSAFTAIAFLPLTRDRDFKIARNLDIFFSLFREINAFYVDDFDPDKLMKSAIDNALRNLDPYTVYYPEEDADDIAFMTTGKYGGIGAMVRRSGDYSVITKVYRGFPADEAGIRAGDILKRVEEKSLRGLDADMVSNTLKGDPGTKIEVTVERMGRDTTFHITRERVSLKAVPWYGMLEDNQTAYIRFSNFTRDCADDVKKAFEELRSQHNPSALILDLRGNPGGLLNEATEIVNMFIESGQEVVSTKGRVKQFDGVHKTTRKAIDTEIPLAILINRGSASASEIVAGAIQDLDRGVVVGQRSFGKGLVQITRPLSYNAQLKITTAKYYIPSGRCIQALDFTHRNEDGSVGYIPDSLISEFRTRNGRIVKDGGGITPDRTIDPPTLSQVAAELYLGNHLFDFATKFYHTNRHISQPEEIINHESLFDELLIFLKEKDFSYKTATEAAFEQLIETARQESYYDLHTEAFRNLEESLVSDIESDLKLFRPEIMDLLLDDLLERWFYDEGAIAYAVSQDEIIKEAQQILTNKELYRSILSPASAARPNGVHRH